MFCHSFPPPYFYDGLIIGEAGGVLRGEAVHIEGGLLKYFRLVMCAPRIVPSLSYMLTLYITVVTLHPNCAPLAHLSADGR